MKIYFLSSRPCALTVNDAYFGCTDRFERFAEISLKDNLFIRFTPENAHPISFFLTENILFTPPEGCDVYLLPRAIAVYARNFPPVSKPLKLIAQERKEDLLASVFSQGNVQLSLETPQGAFLSDLPPSFAECTIAFYENFLLLSSPNEIAVYNFFGKRLLSETVVDFSVDGNDLTATLPLSDSLGRTAECRWRIEENEAVRTGFTLRQTRTKDGNSDETAIAEELLPYAFFESVLLGAEFSSFLSEELFSATDKLQEYLGEFVSVTITNDPKICGLVYQKDERLFAVKYFSVKAENGKIVDIESTM